MKTLLNLPNPSADWRGLAKVIAKSANLRSDVTLVVEPGRLRFFDGECREISVDGAETPWRPDRVNDLASKLSLLDWLHERFSQPLPKIAPAPKGKVAVA